MVSRFLRKRLRFVRTIVFRTTGTPKARKRHERSHRLDIILTAGGVKKKGQKREALTWVFGSSDRIRTGDLRLERALETQNAA